MANVGHVEALYSVHPLATHDERHTWINGKMKEKRDKVDVICILFQNTMKENCIEYFV